MPTATPHLVTADEETIDPPPERDVDATLPAVTVQDVDDGLPGADGDVHARRRPVARHDEVAVELDAEGMAVATGRFLLSVHVA